MELLHSSDKRASKEDKTEKKKKIKRRPKKKDQAQGSTVLKVPIIKLEHLSMQKVTKRCEPCRQ